MYTHMYIHMTTPDGSLCLDLPRYTTGSLMVLQWVYTRHRWRQILWKSCLAEGYTMWHCTIPLDMRTGSQFTTGLCSSKLLVVPECGVYFNSYTGIKNNVSWDVTEQKFTSTSDGSAPSISKFHHTTTLLQETKSHGKNEE